MMRVLRIAALLAPILLASATVGLDSAQAQGPEQLVDLSVDIVVTDDTTTQSAEVYLWVANRGNRAAHDVNVEFLPRYRGRVGALPPVGTYNTISGGVTPADGLQWHIPKMPAHAEYSLRFSYTSGYNSTYVRRYNAKVTSGSYERPDRMQNNEAEAWEIWWSGDAGPAEPDYSVRVSAESLSSSSANFTVIAVRPDRADGESILTDGESIFEEGCVNIRLTSGLTAGSPTFTKLGRTDSAPVAATDRSFDTGDARECGGSGDATGVFKLPALHTDLQSIMTLPVTVDSGATLSEQCLTAEIFATPPTGPGRFYDDPVDNVAKVCLGLPPDEPVVFNSGQSNLFTWYGCSEETTGPCDSNVSLELVALGGTAAGEAGSPYGIFDPDNVVVHIPDPAGRATSSDSNSAALVWSTGLEEPGNGHGHDDEDRPGIILGDNLELLDIETTTDSDQWGVDDTTFPGNQVGDLKVEVAGPGEVSTWYHSGSNVVSFYGAGTDESIYDDVWYMGFRYDMSLEFASLGTYTVKQTIKAEYDDDTTDTTDGTEYTDSGTYTFHVGPMADLEVRDGEVNPDLNPDQYALTVAALNNGPGFPLDAEVTIDLSSLPAGVTVDDHIASEGTYSNGKWELGALRTPDYYQSAGKPGPPTLTLILAGADAATATATASISHDNTNHPYTVCIDADGETLAHTNQTDCAGDAATTNVWYAAVCVNTADGEIDSTITVEATCDSTADRAWNENVCASSDGGVRTGRTETECGGWFQGTVYDHKDDNDTVTITSRAGTGGGGEGAPTLHIPAVHMPAVGVSWSEVEFLYGVPVKDYQVQWSTNGVSGWTQLKTDLSLPELFDITIQSGHTRYYRVRAVNQADVPGPWSESMSAMAGQQATAGAPDAPVLTAVPNEPNGRTEILITWSKPVENGSAITSYTLEVADRSTGPWTAVSPQPGASAKRYVYSDGLTGGTRKYFRMLATNMCDGDNPAVQCDSLWSAVVEVTTRAPGISGAPTNIRAVPDGDTAIDVSWDAPQDDGGTTIIRYEVQWSADGLSGWNGAGTTSNGETLTVKNTGMTFGTTRYYRVAARNNRGLSAWSDPPYASATTLSGVPGQPSLTARATDANTIALTWTVPADNGDPIVLYQLEWSEDGSANSWSALTIVGASDTSYNDTGLDPGTECYYQVRAVNGTGNGSWSTARNATTPPAVPGAPTLQATANGENAIDLTWEPPTDDGGADITGYELHVSTDGGANYSRLTSPSASARSYTHANLQPGTTRYHQIRARNQAGLGEFSQPAFANTLTGVPTAPSLTARANGATEIKLTWTKPDDKGSEIQRYDLEDSDDGDDWGALAVIVDSDSEYVHSSLSGGTTRYYRIRAINGNGNGQWSSTRSARTDAGGPDAPVLTATPASDNQIDLSWTVPADNGSSIRGYWVERSVDGNAPWERLTSNNSTTSYSDSSLYRGMTRYYRVAAYNGAGTGPYSEAKSAMTTGDPAMEPGTPTLFRLSSVGRNQVTIAWDPPADDGGAPVTGYEYEVAVPCEDDPNTPENESETNCGFTSDDIKETTSTSARISGLDTRGDYYFQVRAVNPVGKGEWARDIQTALYPSSGGLLQVSPTTVTLNEGATGSYTVRLSHAIPHPVTLFVQPRGPGQSDDLQDELFNYQGRILVPSGWTHPGGEDWSDFTYTWNQGVQVSFTAPDDNDAVDDVAVADHLVIPVPYRQLGFNSDEYSEEQWEQAWLGSSAYRLVECTANCDDNDPANDTVRRNTLYGAGVKVTVRDND